VGDSLPPPAEFDLVDSFARLRGSDAEIVLANPKTEIAGADTAVRLESGSRTVDAQAAADAQGRLVVRVRRNQLDDGIWRLAVVRGGTDVAPLAARLLVQGARPLVLLWGAEGNKTRVPGRRRNARRQRVVEIGTDMVDRALTVLPPQRAAAVRKRIRRTARKLLA
jgi:hypothetical protein